jgi:hypothetical protein
LITAMITTVVTACQNSGGSTEQKPLAICSAHEATAIASGTSAASVQIASEFVVK